MNAADRELHSQSHHQLMREAAGGDDRALARLVQLYHDRVYRFGVRVCRNGFDADDAVQEAFIRLARREDMKEQQGVLSWLFSVVKTHCLRLLRPLHREQRTLGDRVSDDAAATEVASEVLGPEEAMQRWELVRQVHEAIAQLELPYREVLVLRDLEGLSGAETCAALSLDNSLMKMRLHRARQMLRRLIAEGRESRDVR